MSAQAVLYDAPGPKAKARNIIYTIAFVAALGVVGWFVFVKLNEKNQFDADKWTPFLLGSTWTVYILPGLGLTLMIALISIVIALPLGAIFGIGRMSDRRPISYGSGIVVEVCRAIPVLIFMIFTNELYAYYTDIDSDVRPIIAAVTGLVLYNSAVIAEIVRAGVHALPSGQAEAGYALGLRTTQAMTQILLPQAVRAMLPAIVSQMVVILKDTALAGGGLAVADLLRSGDKIAANYGQNVVATYAVIAAIYIVLNFILTSLAGRLQRRLARARKAPGGGQAGGAGPVHIPIDLDSGLAGQGQPVR
jgi:glutamate transport system permease protein